MNKKKFDEDISEILMPHLVNLRDRGMTANLIKDIRIVAKAHYEAEGYIKLPEGIRAELIDWITAYKDASERNALAEDPDESADYLLSLIRGEKE